MKLMSSVSEPSAKRSRSVLPVGKIPACLSTVRYPDPQHLPQPCGEGTARVHLKQNILRGSMVPMSKLPVSSFF
jgi:hypothetical protein